MWGAVKLMLCNKSVSSKKIVLVEIQKILMTDIKTAKMLNDFFSNTIKTVGIPKFNHIDPFSDKVNDPPMKAILKYRKHQGILTIKGKCKSNLLF